MEDLKNELTAQQQIQKRLLDQVNTLNQKISEQEKKLSEVKSLKFDLTPNQIIRNFNDITPFSGEDHYKLKSFLNAVSDCENLCGDIELKCYCLKRVINSKIIGMARSTIMEIPDHMRNWCNVMQHLKLKFRPKETIHQLLFKAKETKVHNLKDLFNKLNKYKSDCSEICDYDNEDIFTYNSIDKELVQILKSKLVPIAQLQIDLNLSLFELDNFLCKSEIYLSDDIIKFEYRIHKNGKNNFINKKFSHNNQKNSKNSDYNVIYNSNFNHNNSNSLQRNHNTNNTNNFNNGSHAQHHNTTNNNNFNRQGQFRFNPRQFRFNSNNSNQFNRNNQNRNETRSVEPMEVDNIVRSPELNPEVNFIEPPQLVNYR